MAEALLRHALRAEDEPLRSLVVKSAGIAASDGQQASPHASKAMKKVDLDIENHQSQNLSKELVDESFAIFCMTQGHRLVIDINFPSAIKHMFLFRDFLDDGGEDHDIPDPYGLNLAAYEHCRDSMVEAIPSIIAWLKMNYKTG